MLHSRLLLFLFVILGIILLASCSTTPVVPVLSTSDARASTTPASLSGTETSAEAGCPVTKPVWAKPPDDAALSDPPGYGYYYINADSSIWASAWWEEGENSLSVTEEGIKMGWFRPAGATLEIIGQRTDGKAPPLEAHASCCYPTRFQASGIYFPTSGCWEITARAAESELMFTVWVNP